MNGRYSFKLLYLKLLAIVVLFSSCATSYKTVVIETAKPTSHMLPEDINSLTLVNRSITNDFRNFDEDSLQQYFYDKGFNVETIILDSLAADTTLKALGELLFESGRYDVVIPEERFMKHDSKFFRIQENLDWDVVGEICRDFDTDALMVIERYYNKVITSYKVFKSQYDTKLASAQIDSKYDVVVKVYDPVDKVITRQLAISDTINWLFTSPSSEEIFSTLPSIKECLLETGIHVALEIDSHFSPSWRKESRIYFTMDKGDEATVKSLIDQHEWEKLYAYWLKFANTSKTALKSKAEFNLALASEMLGDVDAAIDWANKSYYTKYMNQTRNYLLKLKKRQGELERFEKL